MSRCETPEQAAARSYQREWKQRDREERKLRGVCRQCETPVSGRSKNFCDQHLEAHRLRSIRVAVELVRDGLCNVCGLPRDSEFQKCTRCRQRAREHAAKARERGRCHSCVSPQAIGGRCETCWYGEAAYHSGLGRDRGPALRALLVAQDFRCALSGVVLVPGKGASVDHREAKSLGGSNDLSNLRWLSRRVNVARSNMTDTEFLDLCRAVVRTLGAEPSNNDGEDSGLG